MGSDPFSQGYVTDCLNCGLLVLVLIIMLSTSNIYYIVLLPTNIWSSFDTSDIILSEIENLSLQVVNFL